MVMIHRGRNCHNIEVAITNVFNVSRALEAIGNGRLQQFVRNFKGSIVSCHQCIHTGFIHVKTNSFVFGREQTSQRKPYVTETDYGDFYCIHKIFSIY